MGDRKTCTKCGEDKPLDGFYAEYRNKNGKRHGPYYRGDCKRCKSADNSKRARKRFGGFEGGADFRNPNDLLGRRLDNNAFRRMREFEENNRMMELWAKDGFASGRELLG